NCGGWDDPEEGVIVLGPGESAAGAVSFMPFALQS
ncbi:aldose 1-epimerase, partial [Mesorhizobium sp. M2D.F.Ca.ET.160.01.1.1]